MCPTIYQDLHSNSHLCVEVAGQLYLSKGPEYGIMIFERDKPLCRLRPEVGIFVV